MSNGALTLTDPEDAIVLKSRIQSWIDEADRKET